MTIEPGRVSPVSPPHVAATLFGLLRHGQTEWNVLKKIQGLADSPLSPAGRKQTAEWTRVLANYGWQRIVASDQGRVVETVAILNREWQLPISHDPRLREQHWGEWEGLTIPTIEREFAAELQTRIALGWQFAPPGGESRAAVRDRALAALRAAAGTWPGEKILVVCHQGVIKTTLYHLTNRAFVPGADPRLHHDRLHLIACHAGQFDPVRLNIARNGGQ
jgi:broad specificity phosphatase PhoE